MWVENIEHVIEICEHNKHLLCDNKSDKFYSLIAYLLKKYKVYYTKDNIEKTNIIKITQRTFDSIKLVIDTTFHGDRKRSILLSGIIEFICDDIHLKIIYLDSIQEKNIQIILRTNNFNSLLL